jgi:hypothetical protein
VRTAQAQASFTTILPTFFPSKSPMNAPTVWPVPATTVYHGFAHSTNLNANIAQNRENVKR